MGLMPEAMRRKPQGLIYYLKRRREEKVTNTRKR